MIDIRQLRYFQVTAEELHFSRAASRLCIAQSALSRQIRLLEVEIGTPLLARTQRRVELLPAGRLLQERSNQLLEQLGRAIADVRRTGEGLYGKLAVGFIHSSTYGLLPAIVKQFRALYPDIELDLQEMSILEQHVALVRGTIDVGLLRPQPGPAALDVEVIMEEPFLVAVPRSHALARRRQVALKDLADEQMVLFAPQTILHSRVTSLCAAAGFTPRLSQYASKIHTATGLVGAGIGISIVPACARAFTQANVSYVAITPPQEPIPVALGWIRGRETESIITSFRQVARDIAIQMRRDDLQAA